MGMAFREGKFEGYCGRSLALGGAEGILSIIAPTIHALSIY